MKRFLPALFLSCAVIFSCNTDTTEISKDSYEKNKTNLLKKEQESPSQFLNVQGDIKKNIVGQTVVRGRIKNEAALATYKDVTIKIDFFSKTNALLDTEEETIYEQFFPGDSKPFKTKYFAPKGTDSVSLKILNAKTPD